MCFFCETSTSWPKKLGWLVKEMEYCLRPELSLSTKQQYIRKRIVEPFVILHDTLSKKELPLHDFTPEYLFYFLYLAQRTDVVGGSASHYSCYIFHSCCYIREELRSRGIDLRRGLAAFVAYDVKGKEDVTFVDEDLDKLSEKMAKYGNESITWSVTSVNEEAGIITIHAGKGVIPPHIFELELIESIEHRHSDTFTLH